MKQIILSKGYTMVETTCFERGPRSYSFKLAAIATCMGKNTLENLRLHHHLRALKSHFYSARGVDLVLNISFQRLSNAQLKLCNFLPSAD